MPAQADPQPLPRGGDLIYRQRRATRAWHWINALALFVMLMSGLMIFNAHPELYWGKYGADHEQPWLAIGSNGDAGFLRVGPVQVPTTGVLGVSGGEQRAFPGARYRPLELRPRRRARMALCLRLAARRSRSALLAVEHRRSPFAARPGADFRRAQTTQHLAGHEGPRPAALS